MAQCTANVCPGLQECELISVSQKVSLSTVLEAVQGRKQSEVWVPCWNYSFLLRITGDLIGLSLGHSPTSLQALVPVQRNIYVAFSNCCLMENAQALKHSLESSPLAERPIPNHSYMYSCLFLSLLSGLVKQRFWCIVEQIQQKEKLSLSIDSLVPTWLSQGVGVWDPQAERALSSTVSDSEKVLNPVSKKAPLKRTTELLFQAMQVESWRVGGMCVEIFKSLEKRVIFFPFTLAHVTIFRTWIVVMEWKKVDRLFQNSNTPAPPSLPLPPHPQEVCENLILTCYSFSL